MAPDKKDTFISFLHRLDPDGSFGDEVRKAGEEMETLGQRFREHSATLPNDLTVRQARERGLIVNQEDA